MSNKSTPNTTDASGDRLNTADIDKARSAVELLSDTDSEDVESGDETRSYESNGSETSEHLYTSSSIEELLHDINDSDKEGDIQDVCEKDEEQGLSQLHLAAERGHTKTVGRLLISSANVDVLDTNNNTPLHIATLNGHVDIANLLLRKNASVNCRNALGQTSLHLAAKIGHLAIARLLLNSNADINAVCRKQATPLHLAVEHVQAEIVQYLIFNGANVNACNNAKMTPLHLACQNGHTSIVVILLDNNAIVDVMKQSDETPFYLAAKNGHADISDLLLCRGVCEFVLTSGKWTPLHFAVKEGHTKVVEVILKHSCRITGKLTNDGQKLHENDKNLIETRDFKPIQLLKSDGRRVSAGVVLAEKSEPLEIWEDSDGQTALTLAVHFTQPEMVQLLLKVDHCTYSEEHLSKCFDSSIYKIGCNEIKQHEDSKETGKVRSDDEQFETYLENIKEIARALINSSKFNVNHQEESGESILQRMMTSIDSSKLMNCMNMYHAGPSCEILRNFLIQLLLDKGADFNMIDTFALTTLMSASEKGCCDAIQILFEWEQKSGKKLDIDARDEFGETALIKAAERNHVSAIRLLLSHKASVNLQDNWPYCGFTALHAAVYEPNRKWFDFHFFCDGFRKRNSGSVNSLENSSKDTLTWGEKPLDPNTVIGQIQNNLEYSKETARFREEVVKLLLDNDETNVNAIDFRGNTPLDLAVMSSNQITSSTFEALKNHGAIRNLLEPEDEAQIEVARVDKRGRGPLHRLIISRISYYVNEDTCKSDAEEEQDDERFHLMVFGILLRPENFRESATATDDKGRTPLHYAVMLPSDVEDLHVDIESYQIKEDIDLVRLLLEIGSNVNAADIYDKTPLHYAEMNEIYELLVHNGANEYANDKFGYTPRDLNRLRESVIINETNAKELPIGKKVLYPSIVFNTNHVTELSKRKLVETIRIYSQSPRPQESSEVAIWKIWTENDPIRLNRRLNQLKPLIHQFIERLADGIKKIDWRFECQPILVGSADEETKAVISADFDFNFRLIKFSQLCEAFPHPLGPKGYLQLRRKTNEDTKSPSDEKFDSFFNLDQCLLTNEVNSNFKIILEEVLNDPAFWKDELLFHWRVIDAFCSKHIYLDRLCKTVRLRMIHPVEDGDGGFLFVNISTDIAACVHVEGWWSEISLPVGISPAVEMNGCTLVFDQPYDGDSLFSKTFARISFAPLESRIIKESSPLIKAAYIVCKMILYSQSGTTYQLKTCLLYCMEALNAINGSEARHEDEITPKQLAFWVERIMFCFLEFSRHPVYPCYFMPSFRQRVKQLYHNEKYLKRRWRKDNANVSSESLIPFGYHVAYDYYLDLCPDDTTIDIRIVQCNDGVTTISYPDENGDPEWEQFDREEFIRTLSSRCLNNN